MDAFDQLLREAKLRESMVLAAVVHADVLVCGLSSGHVVAWELTQPLPRPSRFATGSRVYSLVVASDRLVCGCDRYVAVYAWSSVLAGGSVKPVATWATPSVELASGARLAPREANALVWDEANVWIGCGDGNAYAWDIEADAVTATAGGHADMILAMAYAPSARQLATGSEDGTVALYDARAASSRRLGGAVVPKGTHGYCAALYVDPDATWVTCAGGTEPLPGSRSGHGGWLATYHASTGAVKRSLKTDAACYAMARHQSDLYVGTERGVSVLGLHDDAVAREIRQPTAVYAVAVADPAPAALLAANDDAPDPDDDLGAPPAIVLAGAGRVVDVRAPPNVPLIQLTIYS